jgi:4-amino-4-deoxy-L-arabinose transferase-like glycosyltransferase
MQIAMARSPNWRDGWLWAILVLGLGVRLIGLDEPLIDWQAWRQADTAAIARNFYEEGGDLLHPQVDWRGTTTGYVETNFPLFPYLVSRVYGLIGGAGEWVGRLFAAISFTAAAFLLYGLAWRLYGLPWIARLSALLFLLFPLGIFFGRAFMPEAMMLLLSIAALSTFERWLESGRRIDLLLAWGAASLCFLVKIPTLYLGFPLVALAWSRWGWSFLGRPLLWAYLLAVLLPPLAWHLHARALFAQTGLTFGIWNSYGYDKWISGLLLDPEFYLLMGRRLIHHTFTLPGFLLVVLGLTYRWGDRREWMLFAWVGGLILYLALVPEGNRRLHYYQIPFLPVGALLSAKVLGLFLEDVGERTGVGWHRWFLQRSEFERRALVALLLLSTGAYSAWAVRPYYRPPNNIYKYHQSCYAVGRLLDRSLPEDALLVVGDIDENAGASHRAQSPTMLYYCHRKGWQLTPDEFTGDRLDSLAALGGSYFIAAGGFVLQNRVFWRDLVAGGVTLPSQYPRFWTDADQIEAVRRRHPGADRNFFLARLGDGEEDGGR